MQYSEIHDMTVEAAREAGAAIRGFFQDEYNVTYKGKDNPLTDADLAANDVIERRLRHALPDTGWLSEESADDAVRLGKSACWIVDPLDGTREFTLGIPEFVVSIAYVVGDSAKIGVLYNPIKEELFTGIVGEGAWFNGESMRVTTHEQVDGARIVCSRTEAGKGWFDPWKDQLELQPVGSVAYKLGLVAAGKAEASFTTRPRNAWDIAGGVAVIEAAGGRSSDRLGQPYRFNQAKVLKDGVCATNGVLHQPILDIMKEQSAG